MEGLGYQVQHWPLEREVTGLISGTRPILRALQLLWRKNLLCLCPEKGLTCTWHVGGPVSIRRLKTVSSIRPPESPQTS